MTLTVKLSWTNTGMGKVRPANSFCAARRQQQKRFNVRPSKKSRDTWIFQTSFV